MPLNDTGITISGRSGFGNNDTCDTTDLIGQDCAFHRDSLAVNGALGKTGDGDLGFDFTRLNADGTDYSGNGNYGSEPWSCVRDNRTGLVWEVKTTDGGTHSQEHRYRWGGLTAQGRNSVERTGLFFNDWNALVESANNNELCGYSDWKVPSQSQLMSVIDFGQVSLKMDTGYFPNAQAERYWTSTPYSSLEFHSWVVDLGLGSNKNLPRYESALVRLVRERD
ncbi:DUF1566 domain-containing protein [Marinibactrum halimedae]|nr:DUF1566 domain-containing protein [Marinibactrum halimedae]MCD9459381.1 DUF1566 domain-containing protein [Marinibactrum halimedae]